MKAAVLTKLRTPWQIQDRPIPKPGASQVLIRVHASGLCFTDIHITEGLLQGTLPRVLGHEVTGRICEIGDAVSSRCVGDRVGVPWFQSSCGRCTWCLSGRAVFCSQKICTGNQIAGGHAEYLVAYADSTILLPNDLEYCDAAPILCAGYTV